MLLCDRSNEHVLAHFNELVHKSWHMTAEGCDNVKRVRKTLKVKDLYFRPCSI